MNLRQSNLGTNLGNICLIFLGIAYIQYTRDGIREFKHFIHGYSFDVLCQIIILLIAAFIVWFVRPNRYTLSIILSVGLLANLVGVFAPAFLSSDLYRYVWDGKVQGAGINPYRYIPADEHLKALRDQEIYPNINRKEYAHTIYPPAAQAVFWAVTRIGETEACMKAAMVGFEAIACLALVGVLESFGRRREEILFLAWNPLCVWEIGSSGHVDAIVIAFISIATLQLVRRKVLTSAFLVTLAGLTKLYPGMLLLLFGRKLSMRIIAACSILTIAAYGIYASVGKGVLGFLAPYTREEGLESGERYFFLEVVHRYLHIPASSIGYISVVASVILAVIYLAWRKEHTVKRLMQYQLALSVFLTLAFTPHYPWYFLWVLPLAVAVGYFPAIVLTLEATYWFATNLAIPGPRMFRMNEYMYAIFFFVVVAEVLWRRFQSGHESTSKYRSLDACRTEAHLSGGRYV